MFTFKNSETTKQKPVTVQGMSDMYCKNTFNFKKQTMKNKLLTPFRAIKNKLLDAIINRANITVKNITKELIMKQDIIKDVTDEISEDKDFCETTVQIVADNILDNDSALETIADSINYDQLAYEVDHESLANKIDLNDLSYQVADQFSPREIAEEFDTSDIADLVYELMPETDQESMQEELNRIDSNILELKDLMYEEVKLSTEKLKKTSNKVAEILQELAREY